MKDKDISNELKILALEAINNAGSGHSGSVLSCGDALYTLYTRHIVASAKQSINRDRFVLSNGHACAGLYAILGALNYFSLDELKSFRRFNALLTGHPEIHINGIDSSTGPLGQGVANAVGMAIAETILNAKFGLSHYTYCMVGDGCLQEGVAQEALSVAGHYKLNKFILLYDKNDVTLDGKLFLSNTEDVAEKFRAMQFNVIEVDGHNIEKIDKAISKAKAEKHRPTVIICHTIIAKGTSLEGSNLSHGKVFDLDEINNLRKSLNLTSTHFNLTKDAQKYLNAVAKVNEKKLQERETQFKNQLNKDKSKQLLFNKYLKGFNFKINCKNENISTREANGKYLQELSKKVENIVALAADLSSSTQVRVEGEYYSPSNRLGRNIALGVREHAMGAIANGIALHGGLVPVCSTFLSFANYMLPPIRMAAMMNLRVMFCFTHSSIYDTNDGGTHLPVEQLDQLRLIPNVIVSRPKDMAECAVSYKWFFENNCPLILSLSRNAIQLSPISDDMQFGAYKILDGKDIIIMSSGSEVEIAVKVRELLSKKKIKASVVSVVSLEVFNSQPASYKNKLLNKPVFVIESSTCVKYLKYTNEHNIFNVNDFGVTGNANELKTKYGYTAESIANKIVNNKKLKM